MSDDEQSPLSRPRYRRGRRQVGVRVFCISQESIYVLVDNVHALGLEDQVVSLFSQFGSLVEHRALDERPTDQFTEMYLMKFENLEQARRAKRACNEAVLVGKQLRVDFACEFESVAETLSKFEEGVRSVRERVKEVEEKEGRREERRGEGRGDGSGRGEKGEEERRRRKAEKRAADG